MPLYRYLFAGSALIVLILLALSGNRLSSSVAVGVWSLVGATDYLAVYVDNPGVLPPDTTPPVVTLIGSATVNLTVGDVYTELGATSTDNVDSNLPIKIFVDGTASSTSINNTFIDTSVAGSHTVTYKATDTAGNTGSAQRTVVVNAPVTVGGGGGNNSGGGGGGGGGAVVPPATPATTTTTGSCPKMKEGDLNCDNKINLIDFSILAYWYKRPLTAKALAQGVDLVPDGKVTLADFSILAYYWGK